MYITPRLFVRNYVQFTTSPRRATCGGLGISGVGSERGGGEETFRPRGPEKVGEEMPKKESSSASVDQTRGVKPHNKKVTGKVSISQNVVMAVDEWVRADNGVNDS